MTAMDNKDNKDPRTNMSEDMLEQANKRAAPKLQLASSFSPSLIAGIAGISVLGIFTFSSLSASRDTAEPPQGQPSNQGVAEAITPVRPSDIKPVLVSSRVQPLGVSPFNNRINQVRVDAPVELISPALVVDRTKAGRSNSARNANVTQAEKEASRGFLGTNQVQAREPSQAVQLDNITDIVPEGSVIAGTLETAINSDLPGHLRAVVSRDVMGFDGRKILIPKGSRLVGQYQSELATGQRRVLVIWERLIRNDGVSIRLDSPGTDASGQAGVTGKVKSHFFRRFGSAALLSVIQAGSNRVITGRNGVLIAGTGNATSVATSGLEKNLDIPPTIKVAAGTSIRIFLSRDLDFSAINSASE